ncbi:ATP-dependent nuclease [Paenibacillus elgii]|uniref:ATP-dependent nuclease n=1 Tax=Paenibacillus elgii TaxID=189691 RepID=UPI000248CB9A|nr:AAA family ATPase [Paenibacillus elgii]
MFLKNLVIKNFRNISSLSIDFRKGLNILIGENNAGKSAIIDALRICFNYGKQMRDTYVKRSDFHINRNAPNANIDPIEFHLLFKIEDSAESGTFIDLLSQSEDGTQQCLQIHYKYYLEDRNGIEKIRYNVWGGDNEGQQITSDVLNLLLFVYLYKLN